MKKVQLKPQDIVVALKLVAGGGGPRLPIHDLAKSLRISASEVHAALGRLTSCHLYDPIEQRVVTENLLEFLIHGVRYVFPATPGERTVGIPTASSAPPLRGQLVHAEEDTMVWSWGGGSARGARITPLYPSVPEAASADPSLHELLSLVDALRVGRARERQLGAKELAKRLSA